MANLRINGIRVPFERFQGAAVAPGEGSVPASDAAAPGTSDDHHYLVQSRRLDQEKLNQLSGLGVKIVEEFSVESPQDGDKPQATEAYVWRIPPGSVQEVAALPFVDGAVPFPHELKLSPTLYGKNPGVQGIAFDEVTASAVAAAAAAADAAPAASATAQDVRVELYPEYEVAEVLPDILAAARVSSTEVTVSPREQYTVPPGVLRVKPGSVRFKASPDRFEAIGRARGVRRVAAPGRASLANNMARRIIRVPGADSVGELGAEELLAGDGEVIAMADTGFDRGYVQGLAPSFSPQRVIEIVALGRPLPDDPNGHGTHVAGTIIGHDPGASSVDPAFPNEGLSGVATKARLVVQALFLNNRDQLWGLNGKDLDTQIFRPPYECHGARIHTNSWGSKDRKGSYEDWAMQVDRAVDRFRDLVICFCAGNSGEANGDHEIAGGSIWEPGTAKNCITVGASENKRKVPALTWGDRRWNGKFKTLRTAKKRIAWDPEAIAPFSSRGPAPEQRIKPDVVAPGTSILSTRSWISANEGWGTPESLGDFYVYMCGTSMATPLVAGSAAIVREHLRKKVGIPSPSAALVKAAIINGARPISGPYSGLENGDGRIPNNHQGFGLIDVSASIGLDGSKVCFVDETPEAALSNFTHEGVATTPVWSRSIDVEAGTSLKVTLVWTDEPGEKLVSDLDLIVKSEAGERHGNMDGDGYDRTNNVEQVTWDGLPAGQVQIIVRAEKVRVPQLFALVYRLKHTQQPPG